MPHSWLGNSIIFQGIPTSIGKKPYIFFDVFGGGGGVNHMSTPLNPRMLKVLETRFAGLNLSFKLYFSDFIEIDTSS